MKGKQMSNGKKGLLFALIAAFILLLVGVVRHLTND